MPNAPLCRYIRMSGHRCHALALTGQPYCYSHNTSFAERRQARLARPSRRPPTPELLFTLSNLDDFHVIQQAFGTLLAGLAANTLGPRRANPMLRALSLASRNTAARHRDPDYVPAPAPDTEAILRLIHGKPAKPAKPVVQQGPFTPCPSADRPAAGAAASPSTTASAPPPSPAAPPSTPPI